MAVTRGGGRNALFTRTSTIRTSSSPMTTRTTSSSGVWALAKPETSCGLLACNRTNSAMVGQSTRLRNSLSQARNLMTKKTTRGTTTPHIGGTFTMTLLNLSDAITKQKITTDTHPQNNPSRRRNLKSNINSHQTKETT